jgi:hypothetical protein
MGGGIENTFSGGDDVIDEFDLAETFHVFRFQQLAKALSLRFENAFYWRIEGGVSVNVVVIDRE